jgi:RimJ/RimL family protein N-acetyltransferase
MRTDAEASQILTEHLELVLLGRTFLANIVSGKPNSHPAFIDPAGFIAGAEDVARLRLAQLEATPDIAPWLLRAIVVRETRVAVGSSDSTTPPTIAGWRKSVTRYYRPSERRGYAFEAVSALIEWAGRHGVSTVRACVSPDNGASLALLAKQGFAVIGEQIDEEDGRELVLERTVDAYAT